MADWLAANEKPLAILTEAANCPRRYDPFLPSGENGLLFAGLLPAVQQSREAARAFTGPGHAASSRRRPRRRLEDILACHRMARLGAQGSTTLVEWLVAITIDGMAAAGDEAMLRQPKLSAARIAKMRADLASCRRCPRWRTKSTSASDSCFSTLLLVCPHGVRRLCLGLACPGRKAPFESLLNFAGRALVDWDVPLRMGNSWFDRLVEARKPTRAQRKKALADFERDIAELSRKAHDPRPLPGRSLPARAGPPRRLAGHSR